MKCQCGKNKSILYSCSIFTPSLLPPKFDSATWKDGPNAKILLFSNKNLEIKSMLFFLKQMIECIFLNFVFTELLKANMLWICYWIKISNVKMFNLRDLIIKFFFQISQALDFCDRKCAHPATDKKFSSGDLSTEI